ncbi:MAG: phosphoenolpyruvate kinase [Deltaproteobacteria bacterium]|nr:phosphoenolpyruvate kinase [Deltaproteobacteria bacterium]MDQ3301537.1 phosphoenolpyruvate kinase [Myxococcota bacterium]
MSVRTTLPVKKLQKALDRVNKAQGRVLARYPGDSGSRQPVHTVYGGAHLFSADTARKLGELALRSLETYAPDPATFADAIGVPGELAPKVYERVREKLGREPVEDFRIDFEDGYGNRPDAEEDGHAAAAAAEVAAGLAAGTLPPFIGIRIKPLTRDLAARSLRTLDIFLTELLDQTSGNLPPNFVTTLPKIQHHADVEVLVAVFEMLEDRLGLEPGTLKVEFMVETTQSIFDPAGRSILPRLHRLANGRLTGAHFGTYDYTANCDITAAHQRMRHPACDFAKHMMKVAFAGTGVMLSDGATNIMPVAPHRGKDLTDEQKRENKTAVFSAWRLHADDVRHSLVHGFYQGWDLHPGQLPTRYGAVYGFFLDGFTAASERLSNFVSKAAQATLVGDVFDDAATGQGLLNYFLRGIACGAVTEDEAIATGLTLDEIRGKSFVKIMNARRAKAATT